jgi:two-component system sensor histidine kinase/response regulator
MIKKTYDVKIEKASNGLEAVQLFHERLSKECGCSNRTFKLIFMDLQMPVMGGKESAQQILSLMSKSPDSQDLTRIVALTSYTNEKKREDCLQIGMKQVFLKPISKADLNQVM